MNITFDIIKKDVTKVKKYIKGNGKDYLIANDCPIANALKRTIGKGVEWVDVGIIRIKVKYKSGAIWQADTTKILQTKIFKFDNEQKMKLGRHRLFFVKKY